tara:strand:- start:74 stop:292 length:219 start_codon:yes stop_codon:yes gene_type:complete
MEVIRASHAQKVPQVGCPHIDPVTNAIQVNTKPIGAILFVINDKFLNLKMKLKIYDIAKHVNVARPIQAAGT